MIRLNDLQWALEFAEQAARPSFPAARLYKRYDRVCKKIPGISTTSQYYEDIIILKSVIYKLLKIAKIKAILE